MIRSTTHKLKAPFQASHKIFLLRNTTAHASISICFHEYKNMGSSYKLKPTWTQTKHTISIHSSLLFLLLSSMGSLQLGENEMEKKSGVLGGLKDKVVEIGTRCKKLGRDDPRRVYHCLKVGLSLTIVSLLYYLQPLYDNFGDSGIWAVLTVVVLSEFTVGATLCKGLNRAFATSVAGGLGIAAQQLAFLFGQKGEPIVLALLVFLLAAISTFYRFFPYVKARYDYGVLIFILTFSMVSVSAYRAKNVIEMAKERIVTIIIGGSICIVVTLCVCPVWAGGDLHKLIFQNIEKLVIYLEGFEDEYFGKDLSKGDKKCLQGYKSVLTSKANEDSLANFARWEPGHGRFELRHPWKQYLKIGALARRCAYKIDALHCCITSNIQAPKEIQENFQESCRKMSSESGKALKALATAMKTMTDPSSSTTPHLDNSKKVIDDLKDSLKSASLQNTDLLALVSAATVASILIEIVKCVNELSEAVHHLSRTARFKINIVEPLSEKQNNNLLHRGTVNPVPQRVAIV